MKTTLTRKGASALVLLEEGLGKQEQDQNTTRLVIEMRIYGGVFPQGVPVESMGGTMCSHLEGGKTDV